MKKTLYLTLTLLLGAALYACNPERPGGEEEETGGLLTADPIEWDGTKNAEITYQLLVYSFADSDGDGIGDFQGIIDKLDYLDSLGATAPGGRGPREGYQDIHRLRAQPQQQGPSLVPGRQGA